MSKKKKIIVLVTMVLVLAVAAYLNIALLNKPNTDNTTPTGFLASAHADRTAQRAMDIQYLDEIIALVGDEFKEARAMAAADKVKLVDIMETELLLETKLKAKGFEDVIVAIGSNSNNVNVMVKKAELTREDTAIIYNVIETETQKVHDLVTITEIA